MDRWIQVQGGLNVLASPESFGQGSVLVQFPGETFVRRLTLGEACNACAPLGLRVDDIRYRQPSGSGWVRSNYTADVLNDHYSR